MIISDEHTLLKRLEELKTFLLKQSYPPALIEDSIIKIRSLNRSNLLQTHPTNDKDNNKIPYVTTFNPHNPEIYVEIQNNKSFLLKVHTRAECIKNDYNCFRILVKKQSVSITLNSLGSSRTTVSHKPSFFDLFTLIQ